MSDVQHDQQRPIGTQRTPEYIGRRALREQIQNYSRRILAEPICLLFYIQGRGGLGKTRFLNDYAQIAGVAAADAQPIGDGDYRHKQLHDIRVCRVIDMIDPESRKPIQLQQKLIDGLKARAGEQGLSAKDVDMAFAGYRDALDLFQQSLQHSLAERARAEIELTETFVAGWNKISAHHPLVIRLDTLEWLFNQDIPKDALPRKAEARTGVDVICDWMIKVLPKLQYTLVLLSGRPPIRTPITDTVDEQFNANPLAQELYKQKLLAPEGFKVLEPLTDPTDITHYLRIYGVDPGRQLSYIKQITEGSPLLLSLYAECQLPDPPTLLQVPLDDVTTRLEFEQRLTDTILNPLSYAVVPDDQLSECDRQRAQDKLVLTFCLYILSYARRGIRAAELRAILQETDPALTLTDTLLEELKGEVLVKTISLRQTDTDGDEALFLHDEIWQLIDESGRPRDLGLQGLVLDALCRISRQQVEQFSQVEEPRELLRATADHMTYALTRDFGTGYRFYLIYLDYLLNQRNYEDALVLADLFWRLLMLTVMRSNGPVLIYHDLLAESPQIDYQTVWRHDQLHYVKLLRAQGAYQQATERAETMYTELAADEVFPTRAELHALEELIKSHDPLVSDAAALLPLDPYLFADLALTWATTLTSAASPPDYVQQAQQLCDVVIALLCSSATVERLLDQTRTQPATLIRDEDLLRLRRTYLLGLAYRTRGHLHNHHQDYDRAISDLNEAVLAYRCYLTEQIALAEAVKPVVPEDYLNDNIQSDLAFTRTYLALTLADNGYFAWALRIIEASIHDFAQELLPYQRALMLSTKATIHLQQGEYKQAEADLELAERAAAETQLERATGLVSWTKAQLERWRMNHIVRAPLPKAEALYDRAAQLLIEEHDNLRDIRHDRARFLRDLAYWYQRQGEHDQQQAAYDRGMQLVADAIGLLPSLPQKAMQHAELLETRLTFLIDARHFAEAQALLEEIERIMQEPMPWYGQVVCGKLAMQRAYLWLADETQQDHQRALREAAIGLTRGYVFGLRHRDQTSFERLIQRWIGELVPVERVADFVNEILQDPFYVRLEDLPYQPPGRREWIEAWETSVIFFVQFLAELQVRSRLRAAQQILRDTPAVEGQAQAHTLLTQIDSILQQARISVTQSGRPQLSALQDLQREANDLRRSIAPV